MVDQFYYSFFIKKDMLLLTQNFKVALGVTIGLVLATGCAQQHDLADVNLSDQSPADLMPADLVDQSSANAEQEEDADVVNLVDHMSESSGMMVQANSNPFTSTSFSSFLSGHAIQVDNDANGAHNFTSWSDKEGIDISAWTWESNGYLYLKCPTGSGTRRTEFRDYSNRSLSNSLSLKFKARIFNVPSSKKTIIAQLHNDGSGVKRPYITVYVSNGKIVIERSSRYDGTASYSKPSSAQQSYSGTTEYEIEFSSSSGSTSVTVKVKNLSTNSTKSTTFSRPSGWNNSAVNNSFYFKFGAYMPNGGANNTYSRVDWVTMN